MEKEEYQVFDLLVGFTFFPFGGIYIEEAFDGFFPLGFVARVLSLACTNEYLLRTMDSLVAVQ